MQYNTFLTLIGIPSEVKTKWSRFDHSYVWCEVFPKCIVLLLITELNKVVINKSWIWCHTALASKGHIPRVPYWVITLGKCLYPLMFNPCIKLHSGTEKTKASCNT